MHGWWSNKTGKVVIDQGFVSEPETFESFTEAVERYCALRLNRATTGFLHSFSWHCFNGAPTNYKRIEIPTQPKPRPSNEPAA